VSRAWLTDVLERELADKLGAERDRIADAILDALPIERIGHVIAEATAAQLRGQVPIEDLEWLPRDVAGNAAMAVVGALGDADIDEQPVEVANAG